MKRKRTRSEQLEDEYSDGIVNQSVDSATNYFGEDIKFDSSDEDNSKVDIFKRKFEENDFANVVLQTRDSEINGSVDATKVIHNMEQTNTAETNSILATKNVNIKNSPFLLSPAEKKFVITAQEQNNNSLGNNKCRLSLKPSQNCNF